MKDLTQSAQQIIDELTAAGYDKTQIRDAMEDGAYLAAEGIDQETAEEVHAWAKSN